MILVVCLTHSVRNAYLPLGILMQMAWFMGRCAIVKDLGIFPLEERMLGAIFWGWQTSKPQSNAAAADLRASWSDSQLQTTALQGSLDLHPRTGSYSYSPATLTPSVPQTTSTADWLWVLPANSFPHKVGR